MLLSGSSGAAGQACRAEGPTFDERSYVLNPTPPLTHSQTPHAALQAACSAAKAQRKARRKARRKAHRDTGRSSASCVAKWTRFVWKVLAVCNQTGWRRPPHSRGRLAALGAYPVPSAPNLVSLELIPVRTLKLTRRRGGRRGMFTASV